MIKMQKIFRHKKKEFDISNKNNNFKKYSQS